MGALKPVHLLGKNEFRQYAATKVCKMVFAVNQVTERMSGAELQNGTQFLIALSS